MATLVTSPSRPSGAVRRLVPVLAALLLGLALLGAAALPSAWAATSAPAGLKVGGATPTSLKLTWTSVSGAPMYRVQYSTSSSMASAQYVRSTSTSAVITGLRSGTRYYVKVRVLNANGDNLSSYSSAASGTTASGYTAPSGLKATSRSTSSMGLTWGSRGSGIGYRVQYSTSSSMSNASYARSTASSASVQNLKPATSYWFRVRVLSAAGENLSSYSPAVKATTDAQSTVPPPAGSALRVGSFNVKCFSCERSNPNERSWWDRRSDVVDTILEQRVDVIGIQEASQAWMPATKGGPSQDLSQFEDLRNRLGDPWTLTNANRNNCVRSKSPSNCEYKDQGASRGTKILFDRDRVEMLDNGSKLLPSPNNDRYMAWAIFRQRSTGKKFFFATAHLEPNKDWDLHVQEATVLAKEVERNNPDGLPTFLTGDMNSHKNGLDNDGVRGNAVFDVLVDGYGYVDPLGNRSGTTTDTPGATVEKRINTPLGSFNDYQPTPSPNYFGRRPNGTYIDYIFTSKGVRVPEWENVAKLDSDHNYVGKQASDHNMQRATVVLP